MEARAYCPGSISLIFRVWQDRNILKTGSTGVGFTVNRGVVATVSPSKKTRIFWNENSIHFPTVASVINKLTRKPIQVNLVSPLPLGTGFGMSGASALATAYALNELLNLNCRPEELAILCHEAEIQNKTGLGNVGTQITGGFLLKEKPGLPVSFIRFPFEGQKVYSVVFDSLRTSTILGKEKNIHVINKAGDEALLEIKKRKKMSLEDFFIIGKKFALESGLVTDALVKKTIDLVEEKGGHATMHMVGHAVVSTTKKGLQSFKYFFELKVTRDTVHLL